ncbi:MAG: glycosyltransferase [Deltaproteobacteria bacterium]|nr:glycosyltransferase [Deltaproteobacteria bacterium]
MTHEDKREMRPQISVVIAVFNGADQLQRSIASVVNQTYPYKELIIMDGGSTDGTVDLIKANRHKIDYWESQPDRGIYHAWNKALDHTKGDWIYFLGADDYLSHLDIFRDIVPYLEKYTLKTRIVYGRVNFVKDDGRVIGTYGEPWNRIQKRFKEVMCIPHQGVFHHRTLFELHGKFDESYQIAGDYELLLRELKTGWAGFVPSVVVANMQYGGMSSTPLYSMRCLRECARSRKDNGVRGISYLWHWTYLKANTRYILSLLLGQKITTKVANLYRRLTNRNSI